MDNQTDEIWLTTVQKTDTGTGIFVSPQNFNVAFNETKFSFDLDATAYPQQSLIKILVPDVQYLRCVELGISQNVIAFKWVPESLANFSEIQASAGNCDSVLCVKRCAKYGCLCIGGECQ